MMVKLLNPVKWLSYIFLFISFFFALGGIWGSGYEKDHSFWPLCFFFGAVGIALLALKSQLEKETALDGVRIAPELSVPKKIANGFLLTIQLFSAISIFGSCSMLYKILVKGYPTPKDFDFVGYELKLLFGSVFIFVAGYLIRRWLRSTKAPISK